MPKIYQIKLAGVFPYLHPRKGEATLFEEKYRAGIKRHTVRANYDYWAACIDKIHAGGSVLRLDQWSGKPYGSKARNIDYLTRESGLCYCKTDIYLNGKVVLHRGDEQVVIERELFAANDGFENTEDFSAWFPKTMRSGITIFFHGYVYPQFLNIPEHA